MAQGSCFSKSDLSPLGCHFESKPDKKRLKIVNTWGCLMASRKLVGGLHLIPWTGILSLKRTSEFAAIYLFSSRLKRNKEITYKKSLKGKKGIDLDRFRKKNQNFFNKWYLNHRNSNFNYSFFLWITYQFPRRKWSFEFVSIWGQQEKTRTIDVWAKLSQNLLYVCMTIYEWIPTMCI